MSFADVERVVSILWIVLRFGGC